MKTPGEVLLPIPDEVLDAMAGSKGYSLCVVYKYNGFLNINTYHGANIP